MLPANVQNSSGLQKEPILLGDLEQPFDVEW